MYSAVDSGYAPKKGIVEASGAGMGEDWDSKYDDLGVSSVCQDPLHSFLPGSPLTPLGHMIAEELV